MGMIFKIAYFNMLRHKSRTFRSALTIGIGLMFFICNDSLMSGIDNSAINNTIELSTAAITLNTKDYIKEKESYPLNYGISNVKEIMNNLSQNKEVISETARTRFLGQLSNYSDVIPVMGIVVNPQTDTTVFSLPKYLEGSWFSSESIREIILGKKLADELGVTVGGSITLYALTKYDSRNADEFKVIGLVNTTDPNINKNQVLISYDAANGFLDLEGLVTELNISLKRPSNLDAFIKEVHGVKTSILSSNPAISAETFYDESASFLAVNKQKRSFAVIFMAVLSLIAAIGIFNTVLMSVYERIREIGVLRAHGMNPSEISWMFLYEGLITGVLGSLLGVILGVSMNCYLVYAGFPLDKLMGDFDTGGFPVWGTMYGQWNIGSIVFSFIFGIIIATVAGLIPARKAGKMEVTKALKFV